MDWATLPKELLTTIFSFSSCADLTSAVCVNSTWNSLANYDNIWREAILNDSLPHHYSYDQKNVPWRQLVQRYFETKRNLIKKRCVQHTLGTRCRLPNPNASIVLRNRTVGGKYGMIVWETIESQGYSYQSHDHLATELWDLETRTIIRKYALQNPELFNEFIIAEGNVTYNNDSFELLYTKLDPDLPEEEIMFNKITLTNLNYGFVLTVRNEEKNSSLVALHWSNWTTKQKFIHVYDLRTGKKILDKTYDDTHYMTVTQFYGSKLVTRYGDEGCLLVLDVLQDKEIFIKGTNALCATIAGNDLWITGGTKKCLIRHDLTTSRQQTRYLDEDFLSNITEMRVFNGLLWLYSQGTKIMLIDPSSTDRRALAYFTMPGWDKPEITQLHNGAFACMGTSYANILSFRDEDIESPIQVLQIETSGKNEVLHMQQGDLNKKIAEFSPTSVSSQIVFEDETQRYCLIYSWLNKGNSCNNYVDKAKKWIQKLEEYKTAIFQLVHFDLQGDTRHFTTEKLDVFFGPCWVIYETKFDGAWQRASPVDYWKFFKTKLGLK